MCWRTKPDHNHIVDYLSIAVDTTLVLFGDRGLLEGNVPLVPAYCDDKLGASQENFIDSFLRRTLHRGQRLTILCG